MPLWDVNAIPTPEGLTQDEARAIATGLGHAWGGVKDFVGVPRAVYRGEADPKEAGIPWATNLALGGMGAAAMAPVKTLPGEVALGMNIGKRGAAQLAAAGMPQALNDMRQFRAFEQAGTRQTPEVLKSLTNVERGPDKMARWEMDDSLSGWKPNAHATLTNSPHGTAWMHEVYNHPEFYQAYPEMGNAVVVASKDPAGHGMFVPADASYPHHRIYISEQELATDPAGARKVLLHEGMHGVQGIEGFERGASPEGVGRDMSRLGSADLQDRFLSLPEDTRDAMKWRLYNSHAGEQEAEAIARRADLTPDQRRATTMDYDTIDPEMQILRRNRQTPGLLGAPLPTSLGAPIA